MPMNSWTSVIASAQLDGSAVANTTTETSILPTHAKYMIPANFFTYAGQAIRLRAMGRISTVTTTPGTLTFRVKFGSIVVAATQALALNTTAKTNVTWILDWDVTCRSVGGGTTATMMHSGQWQSEAVIAAPAAGAGGASAHIIPASAPAVGSGFDSTAASQFDLTAQWSVASASNSIQLHTFKLESLN